MSVDFLISAKAAKSDVESAPPLWCLIRNELSFAGKRLRRLPGSVKALKQTALV